MGMMWNEALMSDQQYAPLPSAPPLQLKVSLYVYASVLHPGAFVCQAEEEDTRRVIVRTPACVTETHALEVARFMFQSEELIFVNNCPPHPSEWGHA
jgi:hypothetical protein